METLNEILMMVPLGIEGFTLTFGQYDNDDYCWLYMKTTVSDKLEDIYRDDDCLQHQTLTIDGERVEGRGLTPYDAVIKLHAILDYHGIRKS